MTRTSEQVVGIVLLNAKVKADAPGRLSSATRTAVPVTDDHETRDERGHSRGEGGEGEAIGRTLASARKRESGSERGTKGWRREEGAVCVSRTGETRTRVRAPVSRDWRGEGLSVVDASGAGDR